MKWRSSVVLGSNFCLAATPDKKRAPFVGHGFGSKDTCEVQLHNGSTRRDPLSGNLGPLT